MVHLSKNIINKIIPETGKAMAIKLSLRGSYILLTGQTLGPKSVYFSETFISNFFYLN